MYWLRIETLPVLRHILTLSAPAVAALLRRSRLTRQGPLFCPVGFSRLADRVEWLLHSVRLQADPDSRTAPLRADVAASAAQLEARLRELVASADGTGVLVLGERAAAGQLLARRFSSAGPVGFDEVRVVGAGLPLLGPGTPDEVPAEDRQRWSRTIGALGETAWRRLRQLVIAVVGCGRSGSLIVSSLARLGVRKLILCDADRLELHNLGEMVGVEPAALGLPKVTALAQAMHLGQPEVAVEACPWSVTDVRSLAALKCADVVLSAVDNPAARLAVVGLAATYLKPLVDVGTGIERDAERSMGADVRLVLPGHCLLCLGGVAGAVRGRAELLGRSAPLRLDWRRERAGSLLSLNGVAVHLGLRLLEELLRGRLTGSTWLHLGYDAAGLPWLERRQPPSVSCSLCELAGTGDAGLLRLREVFAEEKRTPLSA